MSETGRLHTEDLTASRTPPEAAQRATASSTESEEAWAHLLGDTDGFTSRWTAIQNGFVDEPRRAVEDADSLVAEVIQRLASSFAAERQRLETQWSRGDQVDTEDLRVALQRYRAFFHQLLSRTGS